MEYSRKKKHFVPIRRKILRGLIIIAILSEALSFAGMFSIYLRNRRLDFYRQTDQAMSLLSDSIQMNISELEQGMVYKLRSSTLFTADYSSSEDGAYLYQRNLKNFASLLRMSRVPVRSVYCLRADGVKVYYNGRQAAYQKISDYEKSAGAFAWLDKRREELISSPGCTWFERFPDCPDAVFMFKNVIDSNTMEYLGLMILELDQSYLTDMYQGLEASYSCHIAIYASDGTLLSSDQEFAGVASRFEPDVVRGGYRGFLQDYLVSGRHTSSQNWTIAAFMRKTELLSGLVRIMPYFAALSIGIFLLALFIARKLSRTQTESIDAMVSQLGQIQAGNQNALSRIDIPSNDEMSCLQDAFNQMIDQLNRSVQRIAYATVEKERAEYSALMAQMDPHFLYNTLEGINSLARMHGDRDIVECINRLSMLYRVAVHGEETEIPLRTEISYVEAYLALEKMITGGRMETVVDAEENTLGFMVPKLIVQPIVENSIRHGVEGMKEGGTVIVSARAEAGMLLIDVADNGRGMSGEQIRSLLQTEEKDAMHVGIGAVRRRIQLLYGNRYGLRISSGEEGTTVTIVLPLVTAEEQKRRNSVVSDLSGR